MNNLVNRLHSQLYLLKADKSGATAAEYALLISLIAVAIIVGAGLLGTAINTKLTGVATSITG